MALGFQAEAGDEESPKEGEVEAEGEWAYCPGVTWKNRGVLGSEIEVNLKKGFESTAQDNTLLTSENNR